MNIQWNADKYTADFSFIHQCGESMINLIEAGGNGTLLDLGCGNGALSKTLHDKGYQVTGMDASEEMLNIARNNYPDIEFVRADATDFSLTNPVDVVFSNAVFHWIDKERQSDMLRCVYHALKENGQFIFEFGGYGNNRLIHQTLAQKFAEYNHAYKMPFYFPTIGEYAALLEQAGFLVKYAVLFDRPTKLQGENGLKDWIRMFVQTPFSVIEDGDIKETIIDTAVNDLRETLYKDGIWYADYVRIRMKTLRL